MNPRDYKHSGPRSNGRDAPAPRYGSWVSFVSGLGFGLVVAFGVYLWSATLPSPTELAAKSAAEITDQPHEAASSTPASSADADVPYEPPRPKFDFYKILPEMEVPVQEWELATEDEPRAEKSMVDGAYVLQVGSFKSFEEADRAKASLALRGITANVQRVVINGQDVWFRVHIGPLTDLESLRVQRMQLIDLNVDFIVLKLGGATP